MSESVEDIFFVPPQAQAQRRCAEESCRKLMANSNKGEYCFACQEKIRNSAVRSDAFAAERAPTQIAFQRAAAKVEPRQKPTLHNTDLCGQCGKPRHKGGCKGFPRGPYKPRLPAAVPAAQVEIIPATQHEAAAEPEEKKPVTTATTTAAPLAKKRHGGFDILQAEAIAWADVPAEAKVMPKRSGRLGNLWAQLVKLDKEGNGAGLKVLNRSIPHGGSTLRHTQGKAKAIGREIEHRRDADRTTLYMRLKPKTA